MIPTAPAHDVASRLPHLTSREGDRQKHFFPNSNHATQTAFRSRKHDSHTERRSRLLLRIPQGPLWSPPEPRRAAHSPRRSRRPSVVWKTAPICQNHSAAHALHGKSSTLYSERARSWWWCSVSSGWREWSRLTWQHSSSLVSYNIFCQNIIKFTDYNTPNTYFLCCGGKKKGPVSGKWATGYPIPYTWTTASRAFVPTITWVEEGCCSEMSRLYLRKQRPEGGQKK